MPELQISEAKDWVMDYRPRIARRRLRRLIHRPIVYLGTGGILGAILASLGAMVALWLLLAA